MNWNTFDEAIRQLAEQIHEEPELIIGITRGGIVPARCLSSLLQIQKMHCLSVLKVNDQRQVVTEIHENLKGQRILLVEDVLETGLSLQVAKVYLEQKGALVQTACLYILPTSSTPDYYLEKRETVPTFPWE